MDRKELKDKAVELRNEGYSYTAISEKIAVAKSTLSDWLSGMSYSPNKEMLEKIGKARIASNAFKKRAKSESLLLAKAQAETDIGNMTNRDLFMLGLGLYLGEGTKTHNNVRVINSNPKIITLAIRWFGEVCGLKMDNFKIRLHLYPDNNVVECQKYWSLQTKVPVSSFYKAHIDARKDKKNFKRRKLPFGTAHLSVKSNGKKEFGVVLSRRINAWVDKVLG
jgi:transcriptional regulator with XRE-family HTH domain